MFKDEHPGHHSVCQTLREVYREVDNEDTKLKVRLAFAMAKRMHERLKYYKYKYEPERESHANEPRTGTE